MNMAFELASLSKIDSHGGSDFSFFHSLATLQPVEQFFCFLSFSLRWLISAPKALIMDCVSPILNAATCLWDRSSENRVYIRDLEKNLKSLEGAMSRLEAISKDVKTKVQVEEEQQRSLRTNQVSGWLQSTEEIGKEVPQILERGDKEIQNKCVGGCCPRNCRSTYKLGKIVINKLNAVNQLLEQEKGFDVVTARLPRARVDERPLRKTVGLDSMFEKVWRWVMDENVGIIGLFGTGGVGKTTLLTKINNQFLKSSLGFDVVIWVDVPRDVNVESVQDEILISLGFSNTLTSQAEKKKEISRVLSKKAFVLLLDDLWRPLDLITVGVPVPDNQNKSRVVFTTRCEDVCGHMEATTKIRVEFLSQKDAWELFKMKVGEETLNLHPDIPNLAMAAAEECGGLPIALVAIGRAMASKKTLREWKQALKALQKAPSKISGMGDSVFPRLKLSYDSLSNYATRSCFIYCSLYPGDIWVESLVDLWIGEGFLGEFDNINDARNEGRDIIESLKLACLLESYDLEDIVGMHDVIRDMALWIGRDCGSKMDRFVVQRDDELIEGCEIIKWKEAERISLWDNAIEGEKLNETPTCPNLLTLVVGESKLETFPSGFFQFMPVLRVLDLSCSWSITELPMEISGLVSLQLLDISSTNIRELPVEFKNLVNLKFLKLRGIPLDIIPEQVISSLSILRVLDMSNTLSTRETTSVNGNVLAGDNEGLLVELECLEYLEDLRITIKSIPAFQLLHSSHKLRNRTVGLTLRFCEELTSLPLSTLKDMKRLEYLAIVSCVNLKKIRSDYVEKRRKAELAPVPVDNIINIMRDTYFQNLTYVLIQSCHNILDLTCLIFIPSLLDLRIFDCQSVEEVICDDDDEVAEFEENSSIFSRLQALRLVNLPELKSIYRHALPFPSLALINVRSCPKLKKLPLDSNSAKNCFKRIEADTQWWDELEWDADSTRLHFLPYLRYLGPRMF